MPKFRKKPVEIEAVQMIDGNTLEVVRFIGDGGGSYRTVTHPRDSRQDEVYISTLEGEMRAVDGDWIVKGIAGEFYPCKPDIFERTYEPAEAQGCGPTCSEMHTETGRCEIARNR